MENINDISHMANSNTGVVNPTPVQQTCSYEEYMMLQSNNNCSMVEAAPSAIQPDEQEKPYTFRKLNSTDLFLMIKVISKIGLDELTQVIEGDTVKTLMKQAENHFTNNDTDTGVTKENGKLKASSDAEFMLGVGIVFKLTNKILEHLPSCENDVFSLLASVSGMSVDEVRTLDLDVFLEMVMDFIKKEEFKSFFKVASRYINL